MADPRVSRRPHRHQTQGGGGPANPGAAFARTQVGHPRNQQRRDHRDLLAQQRGQQGQEGGRQSSRRRLVNRERGEEPHPQVRGLARPGDHRAGRLGEEREAGRQRRPRPRPDPAQCAVEQQRRERQSHGVQRGHGGGVIDDPGSQGLVVDLVGEGPPERHRATAVQQRVPGGEQLVVEKVEVLGDRFSERRSPGVGHQEDHGQETQPHPRVARPRRMVHRQGRLGRRRAPTRSMGRASGPGLVWAASRHRGSG